MPREYDVTYAVKEKLLENGWNVLAFDPPGSQGTFSIPNPKKETGYKGQTGTKAPDIIATKDDKILLVECKPYYNENDVDKLINLTKSKERKEILFKIIKDVSEAQDIDFSKKSDLIIAKAHAGKIHNRKDVVTLHVEIEDGWNPEFLEADDNFYDYFEVTWHSPKKYKKLSNF